MNPVRTKINMKFEITMLNCNNAANIFMYFTIGIIFIVYYNNETYIIYILKFCMLNQ